nr:CDC42 small effector protein 2 isoform X3 [Equus asinus]
MQRKFLNWKPKDLLRTASDLEACFGGRVLVGISFYLTSFSSVCCPHLSRVQPSGEEDSGERLPVIGPESRQQFLYLPGGSETSLCRTRNKERKQSDFSSLN